MGKGDTIQKSDRAALLRRPLGIYLHIPFCVRKCLYCDFLSFSSDEAMREKYVQALLREIEAQSALYEEHEVKTVFFGGGTPSLLSGEQIGRIMECLAKHFHFGSQEEMEITMEANPGTVDLKRLAAFRSAGVNRLSLGLQSASDAELRALGRIHTWEDFLTTYQEARRAGFTNLNVDLMSALPGQSAASWLDTLKRTAVLEPEHLSAYSLIVEEGTPFYALYGEDGTAERKGLPPLPDEDEERLMYEQTGEFLASLGYERYEISNYAKPGFECRHNASYWKRVDYAGFGLGAASLRRNVRWSNTSELEAYLKYADASGLDTPLKTEVCHLTEAEQMEEFMFLGLRMTEGISSEAFAHSFGRELEDVYREPIARLKKEGLLVCYEKQSLPDGHRERCYRLTNRGIDVSNYALAEFLFP